MIKLHFFGHTISVILILEANFMKKLFSIVLALVLTFSLSACGCQANKKKPVTTTPTTMPTTAPTTVPTTAPTVVTTAPTMDPTIATNIPDPSVDPSMTDSTEESIIEDITDETGMDSRMRRR